MLNISSIVGAYGLPLINVFQHFPDFTRRPDRDGQPLVHLRRIPIDLGEGENLLGDLGDRAVAALMRA